MSTICVVGDGIAVIVGALLSARRAKRVVLIEKEFELYGFCRSQTFELKVGSPSFCRGFHFLWDTGIAELDRVIFGDLGPHERLSFGNRHGGGFYESVLNSSNPFVDARNSDRMKDYASGFVEMLEYYFLYKVFARHLT